MNVLGSLSPCWEISCNSDPQSYPSNIYFTSFYRGCINFSPIGSFPSEEKSEKLFVFIYKKNVQYRVSTSHQLFRSKTPQCNWDQEGVYKDDAPFYCTITKCLAQFKNPQRAFEHSRRMGPTSTIITHLNIQAIQRIGMCDRKSLSIV